MGGEELRLADRGVQGRGVLVAGDGGGKRGEVAQALGADGRKQPVAAPAAVGGDHRAAGLVALG